MLSDTPPERDSEWTESGVEGAWRFVQRLWRLVDQVSELSAPVGTASPAHFSPEALALRRVTHKALAAVSKDIEQLRFNRAIAHIYEVVNAVTALLADTSNGGIAPDLGWGLREAGETIVRISAPMVPHLAEESWRVLGHENLLAEAHWPEVDPALLVDDTITLPVQVNGKRRDELVIARDADRSAIEAAALDLVGVQRALGDKPVRKIIVVPQRIVNVVA